MRPLRLPRRLVRGTNFALFSAHAERVELCLLDHDGRERERILLPERSADLVSFARKHNEKNLEGNHDGENENDSANFGVEAARKAGQ